MFKENLAFLRERRGLTQEELANAVGVARQTVAKWESGASTPDLEKSRRLADALDVSLDELANYDADLNWGLDVPPKGKHFFGVAQVDEQGRITLPAKARRLFKLDAGDWLAVLGDEDCGIALVTADRFLAAADMIKTDIDRERGTRK
ncbi:MAG: helix-turn-helix domain-containing protein [Thermoguttaceae bacterium]|nr:helix-turn-helix transcriptional regulator [Thermoguttaceae bacterium]